MSPVKRLALLALAPLAIALAIFVVVGWREAQRDPVVRRVSIGLPGWPAGVPPIEVLLVSDLHVSKFSMTPERLARIVGRLNMLGADAILIAGDLVSESLIYPKVVSRDAIAPLAGLRAPLGVYAVLGNHDHARGVSPIRRALARAHVVLLEDKAVRVGPVIVGGIDDSVTDHSDFEGVLGQMAPMRGPRLLLSHGTSHFDWLPPSLPLMLSGHTHCGQIRLPGTSEAKRPCGITRGPGHVMITTAGLGTSVVPLRFDAPPDVWLIRLGPSGR